MLDTRPQGMKSMLLAVGMHECPTPCVIMQNVGQPAHSNQPIFELLGLPASLALSWRDAVKLLMQAWLLLSPRTTVLRGQSNFRYHADQAGYLQVWLETATIISCLQLAQTYWSQQSIGLLKL